jgi:hypothetical protein
MAPARTFGEMLEDSNEHRSHPAYLPNAESQYDGSVNKPDDNNSQGDMAPGAPPEKSLADSIEHSARLPQTHCHPTLDRHSLQFICLGTSSK